jgi:hypothetical protein
MPDQLVVPAAVAIWVLCTGGIAWLTDWLLSGRSRLVRIVGALGCPVIANALFFAAFIAYLSNGPAYWSSTIEPRATDDSISIRPNISPKDDPAAILRSQVSEIGPGLVVFNPPPQMTVGHHELITVRIMRGLIDKFAKQPLEGRGTSQSEQIKVGSFMRVRLFGEAFEVKTHSDEAQAVADNDFAEWLYDVLPTKSGDRTLTLQIAIRYKLPSSEEITNLPVLTRDISVEVNPWWTVSTFLSDNWQWFFGGVGGLVLSVGGFFGKRWFEKRSVGNKAGYADS